MMILGIDPGSTRSGFGVIKKESGALRYLKSGLLHIPPRPLSERLMFLEKSLIELLAETQIQRVGLEKLFFAKNKKTALEVAGSRGVILSVLAKKAIPFVELTPTEVKSSITGNGRASKQEVAKMVYYSLAMPKEKLIDDAIDALAIAIVVAHMREGLTF